MQPFTSDQSYQNFIDGAETNYLRAYYWTIQRWLRSSASTIPTICFVFPKASRPRFEHEKAERSGT